MQGNNLNPNERIELIEIEVQNTGAREFVLGSLPNLRQAKRIIRIEAFDVSSITKSPAGKAVINAAAFKNAFIRLINSENVEYRHLSLVSLSKTVNGTVIPTLNTPQIDPEKSKITVGDNSTLVSGEVFLLQISYEK